MKHRRLAKLTLLSLSAALALSAQARIGETKNDIQARMLTKTGGAYAYPSKEERFREAMELPYKYAFLIMPGDVKQCFFFKRPDAQTTTAADTVQQHELYGWEVNMSLQSDKSVLEFYRRHGDPMTIEEAVELFNLQKKPDARWKRSEFVDSVKSWEVSIKDGKPSVKAKSSAELGAVLPTAQSRFIYIDVPDDVRASTDFPQSLQAQIIAYEQRNAYAKYRQYLEKQNAIKAQKTTRQQKKTNAPVANAGTRKIIPADGYTHRYVETEFFSPDNALLSRVGYYVDDIFLCDRPITSPTKEVRLTMKIPNQPGTAFGYSFETSDGEVRAKLYKNAVLFFDAKFDSRLREYMESLYKKQCERRAEEAKESVTKF